MNIFRSDTETASGESLMGMALADIYEITLYVCLYHENRILVSSDVQSFPLTYGVELGTVMFSHYLAERILLITGLLDMLLSATVSFSLELYIIMDRN